MAVSIEFDTDNAAFHADWSGEIERVMRQALTRMQAQPEGGHLTLRDTNGNSIGNLYHDGDPSCGEGDDE